MTPEEVIDFAHEQSVQFVDLRFCAGLRRWRHITLPIERFDASVFDTGITGVDGLPAQATLVADASTAHLDPFCQHTTLAIICDLRTSDGNAAYPDNWREVARRAEQTLAASNAVDSAEFGLTLQFNVLDRVVHSETRFAIDMREADWRSGRDDVDNLGLQLGAGEGQGVLPPNDTLHNLRSEMAAALVACDIAVRSHAHGPDSFGHSLIQLAPTTLLRAADNLLTAKYVIRNVAARYGKSVTFLPQPLTGATGNGLPVEIALTQGGAHANVDARKGMLQHAGSLAALCLTTTNSYRRQLAPSEVDQAARAEQPAVWPLIDALCNSYVAFSALLLAALDESDASSPGVPQSLEHALTALEADCAFLRLGAVFPADFVQRWTTQLRADEIEPQRGLPTPFDYQRHFNS